MVRSQGDAALPEFLESISSQHDYYAGGLFLLELHEQIHARDSRQLDVKDDGVRAVLAKKRLGLETIPSLADDGDVAEAGHQCDQPLPKDE